MSKSKKPAKKYRPKHVEPVFALNKVLMRAQILASTEPIQGEQANGLSLRNWASFEAIKSGHGNHNHANDIVNIANMADILAEAGLGIEYIGQIRGSGLCVVEMGKRYERTGKWGFSGPELVKVRELLEIHDMQLESPDCSEGFIMRCVEEVKARIARGQILEAA